MVDELLSILFKKETTTTHEGTFTNVKYLDINGIKDNLPEILTGGTILLTTMIGTLGGLIGKMDDKKVIKITISI